MAIKWKKKKVDFKESTSPTELNQYVIEVFQGDSIDLLDYIEFTKETNQDSLDIWKKTLVNAAYYTDNDVSSPTAFSEYKEKFADDTEIRQYASKYALTWNCEVSGVPIIPPGLGGLLIDKYGILDTSKTGVVVNMTLKIWPNWARQAKDFALNSPTDKDPAANALNIEYLTVKIKSNSLLGEGGLLNSITGSVDKYVTDAMDYVSGAVAGAIGYIGEGVSWSAAQVSSLLGGAPKVLTKEAADEKLRKEKERESNLFSKVIGFPVAALDFLTAEENTKIVKSGLRALSLAAKLYRAYSQGQTAFVTAKLLANLKNLLDFDRLSKRKQALIAKFLGVNPKVLSRITYVVRRILDVEALVKSGNYAELEKFVLSEMGKDSVDELDPELQGLVTGEVFSDVVMGTVVTKKYTVVDKDTIKIEFDNPSFSKVYGNNLILSRIDITSIADEESGNFIPIKEIQNTSAIQSGATGVSVTFASGVTIKDAGKSCEIVYLGAIGKETGTEFFSGGIFPGGRDTITIKFDNSEFDPQFEYKGGNKIKKGYIPLQFKYHYVGNTNPVEEIKKYNAATKVWETIREKTDVLLAEGDESEEDITFNGVIVGSYADKEKQDTRQKYFETSKTAVNAYAVYNIYKKKQFLSIFDAVDFKNLPAPVQTLIFGIGGMVGVDQSQIIRYYEVLSGAKNLYELSTKGFQHYNTLPPELKAKISKQLGVSEKTLGTIIPIAGDLTDMATGKRFKSDKEKEDYLNNIFESVGQKLLDDLGFNFESWEKYNDVKMVKDTSSGRMVRKVLPGMGPLDNKIKQTLATSLGFTNVKELKPPFEKKPKLDADGKKVKDANGNDVMEEVTHIELKPGADGISLSIVKCGIVIDKALQFRENLKKGIDLKNKLLKRYEAVKNTPDILGNEAALMGAYEDIIDTRKEVEKEGVLSSIYDSAAALTADPYADLLDNASKLPPGAPGAVDASWRQKYEVPDKYVVEVQGGGAPSGGVTGTLNYGTYSIYTYDWVTEIIQDSNTGEVILVGQPPPGFVYDKNKVNWDISVKKP
jgi:hypothetical protein